MAASCRSSICRRRARLTVDPERSATSRFHGRAVEQNIVRYDGVEGSAIIDASPGNLNGEVPSPFRLQSQLENVQEFRVDSNNFPAEFGTGTGGQISIVTKSAATSFHGSAFRVHPQ